MGPYLQCNVFVSAERCISSAPPSKRRGLDHCIEVLPRKIEESKLHYAVLCLPYFTCSYDRLSHHFAIAVVQVCDILTGSIDGFRMRAWNTA